MLKKVIFPVTNAVKREKLRNFLLDSVGEYMDVDITIKTIAVLEVSYPEERKDVELLLMKVLKDVSKDNSDGLTRCN